MAVVASRFLTWSNALTGSRLVAAPFFYCTLLPRETSVAAIVPALLFWFAVVTDVADGRVARARGESSAFGGLLDHATDASFVALGLFALATTGAVPKILPLLVVVAFVQYMLDSKSLAGRKLRASALGRLNGIAYFVPLGVIVTRDVLGLLFPSDEWVYALGLVLVATTLISIADRAWTLLRGEQPGDSDA